MSMGAPTWAQSLQQASKDAGGSAHGRIYRCHIDRVEATHEGAPLAHTFKVTRVNSLGKEQASQWTEIAGDGTSYSISNSRRRYGTQGQNVLASSEPGCFTM
mmetsp:Transcript_66766/g.145647  ORF Transcript_66766/g.145647 Transcript_66766/m.145647 type:complete len:102 (-) Transcript_66766:298-603(-)